MLRLLGVAYDQLKMLMPYCEFSSNMFTIGSGKYNFLVGYNDVVYDVTIGSYHLKIETATMGLPIRCFQLDTGVLTLSVGLKHSDGSMRYSYKESFSFEADVLSAFISFIYGKPILLNYNLLKAIQDEPQSKYSEDKSNLSSSSNSFMGVSILVALFDPLLQNFIIRRYDSTIKPIKIKELLPTNTQILGMYYKDGIWTSKSKFEKVSKELSEDDFLNMLKTCNAFIDKS